MTKAVFKVGIHDDNTKRKAAKIVSGISGVETIFLNKEDPTVMTVIGDIDPIVIVKKLRKVLLAEIISVGPPKEEKEEREKGKEKEEKKPKNTDKEKENHEVPDYMKALAAYHPHTRTSSETETTCVIC